MSNFGRIKFLKYMGPLCLKIMFYGENLKMKKNINIFLQLGIEECKEGIETMISRVMFLDPNVYYALTGENMTEKIGKSLIPFTRDFLKKIKTNFPEELSNWESKFNNEMEKRLENSFVIQK